jgi:hypothetical protein
VDGRRALFRSRVRHAVTRRRTGIELLFLAAGATIAGAVLALVLLRTVIGVVVRAFPHFPTLADASWWRVLAVTGIGLGVLALSAGPLLPAKPQVGLRTTRADEMWHIDTTVIRLLDGTRAYVHAVIDNFSRRFLAWSPRRLRR